jgi:hypothetical protein
MSLNANLGNALCKFSRPLVGSLDGLNLQPCIRCAASDKLINIYLVFPRSTFVKNDRSKSLCTFILSLSAIIASASVASAAEDDYIARAVSVSGKVLARGEGGGNVQMAFLKPGDKLYKGSIVNTGSNGAVKLLMTDRTILDLGPSSLFKMNDYQLKPGEVGDRKVDMSLDYGTVRASVNEKLTTSKAKFTIRTKAATMGVRGTEFVVNAAIPEKNAAGATIEPPKMSLTVMHGKVEVADAAAAANAPKIPVTPGLQFAKSGEGMGQVAQLGTADVAKIKAGAFQKDMTFMQAVSFDPSTSRANNESSSSSSNSGSGNKDSTAKGDSKTSSTASTDTSSSGSGNGKQTVADIGATIAANSASSTSQPTIGDLKLPGTFTPNVPAQRPIDQLNGRFVNLRVRVCPNGGC